MLNLFNPGQVLDKNIDNEVKSKILSELIALNSVYGMRTIDNYKIVDGGYVILIETKEDIDKLNKNEFNLLNNIEYAEIIKDYVSVLYIKNNNFSVKVYIPKDICPKEIFSYI